MPIRLTCDCGRKLKAPNSYAGARAECPYCGQKVTIPEQQTQQDGEKPATPPPLITATLVDPPKIKDESSSDGIEILDYREQPSDIVEFWDPPVAPPVQKEKKDKTLWLRRMMAAMLDPRSIQWMLTLGGGLMVLGLIIWLASLGILKNKYVLATLFSAGSLSIHAGGCLAVLKTKYKVAGQALTFLGCILVPMNLWFFHAQGIATLDQHLWLGGIVCCLLYVVTVVVLRDPLFIVAVEAGVTLTSLLLMADLGLIGDVTAVCLFFLGLGLISIHGERAFPVGAEVFDRRRFGLPLFWCGHAQLAVSLIILLCTQAAGWLLLPARDALNIAWDGNSLTHSKWLAGGLWLIATYVYIYSDFVVRRVGVYTYLAAVSLVMAEVTLVGLNLNAEGLIAVLAITASGVAIAQQLVTRDQERFIRTVAPLAMVLSVLPVLLGLLVHIRTTSELVDFFGWSYQTGWLYVGVMVIVAACNRLSAFIYRKTAPRLSATYFFLSAAGLIVAAAGLLRVVGCVAWSQQSPLLMLIPIIYIVAARLWRGHSPERPLGAVAHTATVVILVHVMFGALKTLETFVAPVTGTVDNLLLGLVFFEASLFYALAAVFRRKSLNVYFAAAAACGALWQLVCYWAMPSSVYTLIYTAIGIALLIVARQLGYEQAVVYTSFGTPTTTLRGRGVRVLHSGYAILTVAFVAALLQGLARIVENEINALSMTAMVLTTAAAIASIWLVPAGGLRAANVLWSVILAGVTFLTFNVLIDLTMWQKLEILCVATGVVLVVASYIGRFREEENEEQDWVSLGLWFGSILSNVTLLLAVFYHRLSGEGQASLPDEIALLTVSILMLATGVSWQIKSTTVVGTSVLTIYLVMLVISLAYFPQVAIGVYLAIGGAALFGIGVALSVYRERLLELPERFTNREGLFRIINWR